MFGGSGGGGGGGGDGQNYVSSTGHSVFMRGLPFRADEDAVKEVGISRKTADVSVL